MPNIQAARLIDNLRRLSYLDLETVKRIAQDPDLVWRPVNKFTCETAEFVILARAPRQDSGLRLTPREESGLSRTTSAPGMIGGLCIVSRIARSAQKTDKAGPCNV